MPRNMQVTMTVSLKTKRNTEQLAAECRDEEDQQHHDDDDEPDAAAIAEK